MPFAMIGDQLFSRPKDDAKIMRSWESFVKGNNQNKDALRSLIDDSWRRCIEQNVNPLLDQAPPPIGDDGLYKLREISEELIDTSAPIMASARDFLSETGTVMVLTDEKGLILNREGDNRLKAVAENIRLLNGASWNEQACGTNAIGTALATGLPVQIHSAEHFCSGIKQWSCSASVIRDPIDNRVLGVIDISGLSKSYNRQSLGLVVATAGRIESKLANLELEMRFKLLEETIDYLGNSSDKVIVFDRRGRLVKTNGRIESFNDIKNIIDERLHNIGMKSNETNRNNHKRNNLRDILQKDFAETSVNQNIEAIECDGKLIGSVLTIPDNRNQRNQKFYPVSLGDNGFSKGSFENIIGNSKPLIDAINKSQKLAKTKVPILLLGESGVGKEMFANAIHNTMNPKAPFVAINCGSFSRDLLSSELFGYVDGAFTGARKGGMAGKIEAASGGTLFLDEIGEMPIDMQPHFLRVLEDGMLYRLGDTKPRKVEFRLICATNRDLKDEITQGRFRMDLFYRIAVTSVNLPPLRERPGDITLLVEKLAVQIAEKYGLHPPKIHNDYIQALMKYSWEGNVRELRNVIESSLLVSDSGELCKEIIPAEILSNHNSIIGIKEDSKQQPANDFGLIEASERETIIDNIKNFRGNMTLAAKHLGIAKSTLYAKVKRYGLEEIIDDLRNFRA